MNTEQCEERNKMIIKNPILWAKGEECDPLTQLDILLIGEYVKVNILKCFHHFIRSDKNDCARLTGAERTIFKTLDKLKYALLKYDSQNN